MQGIVEKILDNSKRLQNTPSPRQLFYHQFDASLRLAQQDKSSANLEAAIGQMENYGKMAQIPVGEIAHRKMTLLWTLANA